jgi:large subunit ribosomal protein L18
MKYQISDLRKRRKRRIRKKIFGTPECPRLVVFRSNKNIYAQIIDDQKGHTLASADLKIACPDNQRLTVDNAKMVGELIAKRATGLEIKQVVFDRNGFIYHGRIKALADGAREGGLKF